MNYFLRAFICIILLTLLQCAHPVAPQGGPKDTTPPKLNTAASTQNRLTNFDKKRIELTFDEWIALSEPDKHITISPPLVTPPKILLNGKTVRIIFDDKEVLHPNTTYTINFSEAVRDFTEGNPKNDLTYIFSTGNFIDSLSMKVQVTDAYTGEAVEGALVLLYDKNIDSVFRKERPYYFGRTNKEGKAALDNLSPNTYKVCVLVDADVNYQYNQASEKIGFSDSLIVLNDTSKMALQFQIYTATAPLQLLTSTSPHYGLTKLSFNQQPHNLTFNYQNKGQRIFYEYEKDSINVWYDMPQPAEWELYVSKKDTNTVDTVRIKAANRQVFIEKDTFGLEKIGSRAGKKIQTVHNPTQPYSLVFNHPIATLDTSKIVVFIADSTKQIAAASITIDTTSRQKLIVQTDWRDDRNYTIALQPRAVTDWFGLTNDSITYTFKVGAKKGLGDIHLIINKLNSSKNYLLQIWQRDELINEQLIIHQSAFEHYFKSMSVAEYTLRLIQDDNENGRWDAGNYDLHLQPEKIWTKKVTELRGNWELVVKIGVGDSD